MHGVRSLLALPKPLSIESSTHAKASLSFIEKKKGDFTPPFLLISFLALIRADER